MVRVKRGVVARHRRKKVLQRAKGFRGSLHRLFRQSKQAVIHALSHATRHRRKRKRDFRRLWISRVGAAARQQGLSYQRLLYGLRKAKVALNRKMLSELAVSEPDAFSQVAQVAKEQLS